MIEDTPKNALQKQSTELSFKEKKDLVEQTRIQKWKENKLSTHLGVSYSSKTTGKTISMTTKPNDLNLSPLKHSELVSANLHAATGTTSENYGRLLISNATSAMFNKEDYYDNAFQFTAVHEALIALKPVDEIEGQMCGRLIVLHDQYMHFMSRVTNPEQSSQGVDMNINRATKLMRSYNEALETLNRYRRKGEQRVTVQHVQVNSGGQAVVAGQFNPGEGGAKEKN